MEKADVQSQHSFATFVLPSLFPRIESDCTYR